MKVYELQNKFGIDSLHLTEHPHPFPGEGQVLVKMRTWSLNYRDLLVVKGIYHPKLPLPFIPLSDGVGQVVAVGAGVTRVQPGERVAGLFMQKWIDGQVTETKAKTALGAALPGVAAEHVVFDADGVVPVPAHLTDEEAATLPCAALTAWHALITSGQLQTNETVLVQGTGGVSLFALQFARHVGARVIVTSSNEEKLARALKLGATDGINYRTTPAWGKRVRELIESGVDHVVEVGGAGTLPESLRAVRMGGRISLIGVLSGAGQVDPLPILMRNICVQGIYVGSRVMFEAMNATIAQHQLRPVIDQVFPFENLPDALRHMEKGAHFGKIVLRRTP